MSEQSRNLADPINHSTRLLWCLCVLIFLFTESGVSYPTKKNKNKASASRAHTKKNRKNRASHKASTPPKTKQTATEQKVQSRQRELLELQKSIADDRKKLDELRGKENLTLQTLSRYRRHSSQIQRYISLLEEEISALQDKAGELRERSESTSGDLWRLRKRYAQLVRNAQMSGTPSTDEMLIAPNAKTDAALNDEMLKRVTKKAATTFHHLASKRDSLSTASNTLLTKSELRAALLQIKSNEQSELDKTIRSTQQLLDKIRNDKTQVLAHRKKCEQSAKEITTLIASMVTREHKTKGRHATEAKPPGTKNIPTLQTSVLKVASLPYPVMSRKILHPFGTYKNPITKTETNNPGIDIAVPYGSNVSAVSAGTVSLIQWLPAYGTVVILDHQNGVRSVYANLSSVGIKQGQHIDASQYIGKSGESIDGEFLHLELWHERQRVNPASYLK